ncbi:MAG: GGDEF domain-containing protein [Anaerovibrio sp.]|uniref:GGDEF domain-containing protein n=1 Tax=Anaerovibrio sp. TaxID=1872532 RepID=UPI0025D3DE9E|nr:GGDEF domain-containing protein [Anaerovibrio sp.]MCR5175322.1 GGDEF domain-containing protein [Anaerovibrio sp.]
MTDYIGISEAYTSTFFVVLLILVIICNNLWRFKDKRGENRFLSILIISVLFASILDCLIFSLDGMPGEFVKGILYIGNTALYIIDITLCCCMIVFIIYHLIGYVARLHIRILIFAFTVSTACLFINLFVPIIFSINEYNQYTRGPFANLMFIIAIVMILYFFVVYKYIIHKGGGLKFFPITLFIAPILLGLIIQMFNYGLWLIWPTSAISLTAIIFSLQNEMIFRDKLTGVYNRQFFDRLSIYTKHRTLYGLMFIDLNNFKDINDRYGHNIGDKVLKLSAEMIQKVVGASGTVIRYGGDEFVVLVNTSSTNIMDEYLHKIKNKFYNFNYKNDKPYSVSVSVGYSMTKLTSRALQEAVKKADARMYMDKEKSK